MVCTMTGKEHVVLFPFMAQGHFIPFVALARIFEMKTSFTITIVTTTGNINTLQSAIPQGSTIRLASLPFNSSDHGLPPNSESTDNIAPSLLIRLFEASQTLEPSFERLVSDIAREDGDMPLCIISDMFLGWTVETANRLGIFHSVFFTAGAYGMSVYSSLWFHLPHTNTDSPQFSLPDFPELGSLHRSQLTNHLKMANGSDSWSVFVRRELSLCLKSDALLFNTVEELEPTGLAYFRKKTNRPVWAVGPLKNEGRGKESGVSVQNCLSWLNLHPPSSVLFISFGSQYTISATQMMELAMGLEESGKAFIWVVKPPIGFDVKGEFKAEWLPEGFEQRIAEKRKGILVKKWAPQLEILSHEATAAFLSHCGWNSTLESLSRGVPILGWPLSADQFYNSKVLEEEAGVCVEIARGDFSEINKDRVSEVIEMVMGESEKGESMRKKALEIKKMMNAAVREKKGSIKGSSVKAMDEFIATAISARRNKNGMK